MPELLRGWAGHETAQEIENALHSDAFLFGMRFLQHAILIQHDEAVQHRPYAESRFRTALWGGSAHLRDTRNHNEEAKIGHGLQFDAAMIRHFKGKHDGVQRRMLA